ncbi:hypothetical protein SAMN05192549_114118 [Duganella sacchari]|uniref:4-amino-4-deoxy-L-arabinose transferase n=1 Tax=Duganella sacchari TaxID=551987 RepID=A0A1M7R8M2_9BURK|nr:hypothetical protein [Duganella sacchari]SHN42596.1 hypothetical protein SAMN05192549_114118 [Duganella sacchari]
MLTRRWLPLLLGLNLLLLVFYLLVDYQLVYHSDSAVKNLLAQEIYETGQYFPLEWNYVNHDLWVFYTQTFIIPLLPFFHNGYLLHVASDLVSAAFILCGSWLLTGLLEQSRLARLLGMLVVSGGMSLIMAEHIYGQAAYGSMYYMACFLIYAYWSFSQASGGKRLWWAGATAVLTLLVFWANPQRALLFYGLPLLAGGAVQQALEWRAARDERRAVAWRQAQAMGVVLLGLVAGTLLSAYTLSRVNSSQGLTDMHWLNFDGMAHNLLGVVNGIVSLFDGIPRTDGKVASLKGAYAALRLVGALLLVCLLPWGLCKALQPRRGPRQLVVVFAAVSFAANLFVMVATSVADMSSPDASVRYLVPSLLYMLLIFVGLMVDRRAVQPMTRAAGLAAIALLATSAPSSYLYPFNEFSHLPRRGLILKTPDLELTDFLKQQGLQYGYGTFWIAGKSTVLSSGAVRMRPVSLERGLPLPTRKLSSNRWYTPAAWQGPTFLVVRDHELQYLNQPLLASYAGQPRVLHYQDATILIYPRNLAAVLPNWDNTVRQPVHYRMDANTLHERGTIADGVITAQPGEAGALHFGPMRMLAAGSYAVSFDLDASGDGQGDFGMVDVVTQTGHQVHARQPVAAAGKQRITLQFTTPNTLDMVEFRAFSSGRGRFALSGIDVVRIPQAQEKP